MIIVGGILLYLGIIKKYEPFLLVGIGLACIVANVPGSDLTKPGGLFHYAYQVIENGKATGKFINAANIDGTKRTLKHNAYVYKSSKKRANKVVLKKGTEVVTYGGAYTFKNGKQYYKIGNNTDKTYVKVSNF